MVDILSAVLTDGLVAIEAAPQPKAASRLGDPEDAEALGDGVHSADVILNILARQREPWPPLTIATPVALRLGCEPVADCARPTSRSGTASGGPSDGAFRDPRRPKGPGGAGLELFGMKAAP